MKRKEIRKRTDSRGFHKDPEYLARAEFSQTSNWSQTHTGLGTCYCLHTKRDCCCSVWNKPRPWPPLIKIKYYWNRTYLSNNYALICSHHAVLCHILQDHLIKQAQVEFWVNGGWCIGKVSLKWFALIALLWVLKCQAPIYHRGKFISSIYVCSCLIAPTSSPGKKYMNTLKRMVEVWFWQPFKKEVLRLLQQWHIFYVYFVFK